MVSRDRICSYDIKLPDERGCCRSKISKKGKEKVKGSDPEHLQGTYI